MDTTSTTLHGPHELSAIITFFVYLSIVIGVGIFAFFVTRNLSDYVLGGRRLGGPVAALSAGASDMSSWLLMGLPGAIYFAGLHQVWVSIGLITGAYLCWKFIAKPLRIYSEVANDSVTLPAYLDNRFRDNSKMIRMFAAIAILIFFVFYIASGLTASGLLVQMLFGIDYPQALLLGAAIIMLYTAVGGFLAVSWTDFFQGNLMLICLLVIPFVAMQSTGGWEAGLNKVVALKPDYLDVTKGLTVLKFISLFAWGLGYFGMPHILVRFMAVTTTREIPIARTVCMWWMSLSLLGAVLVGVVGAIHFCDCPLDNRESVFMDLAEIVVSPWMMGFILAAILSSAMCAIDSQMLAASSALTEDFYRAMFRKNASQKELMWVGRLTVGLIAAIAIYIARVPSQSIMDLVSFAWAGLGATFGAAVVLSLFWRRTTRNGIVAGMIAGAVTVIVWRNLGWNDTMYEILPGAIASYVANITVSLLDKKPSPEVLKEFDQVWELAKRETKLTKNGILTNEA